MLQNIKKRNPSAQKGFTIIEVMIVLAIAGLIMLVVFLAVPALQRNSRNTTIKNDASALAAGISEYASNNNGSAPNKITQDTTDHSKLLVGDTGTSQATAKVNGSTTLGNTAPQTAPSSFAAGTLYWGTGKSCDGTTTSRASTVWYYVEVSGTPSGTPKCVDAN